MKKFALPILVITLFASCGGAKKTADDGYYFQDFDNLKMFTRDQILTSEKAHSGTYAAFTDSLNEFGTTFEMDFAYAKNKGYKGMKVTAYGYLSAANANAGLVTAVESAQGNPAYASHEFKNFIERPNEWSVITAFLKLPAEAPESAKIKVYLWSPKKQKVFLDDLEIQFEK